MGLQMPQEIGTCKGMGDEIAMIESWAGNFSDKSKLVGKVTKHFLFHKAEIEADIATLKTDFSSQMYFQVGVEAADIATILLPIQ